MVHPQVSRREFMKGTAGIIAAAAAPYVITSQALGGPDKVAAGNRLTMAHIGIGNQGGGHFSAMCNNKEVQVVAVCDVRKWVRDACQQKAGGPDKCAAYNDYRDLIAKGGVDAVVIAAPDHWHALIATACAAAGMDIFCEKPMSLTIGEARAMVKAVRRYGRVFQTGSQQRSGGAERFGCELVRSGRIGKVKEVYVNVGGPSSEKFMAEEPIPEGLDWDMWLGPTPWKPHNKERCSGNYSGGWRLIRDYSGGMMTDWGAHHFDIAQWGLGMDESGPVEIIPPTKPGEKLMYKYANGVVMYHGGGPKGRAIQFVGENGVVGIDRGGWSTWPESIGKEPIKPGEVHLYKSPGHHADWLNCIRNRQRPICDVAIGASSVTVCHLGNIAYWLGRPLKWDPVKGSFLNDDEANRWVERPMRPPWVLPT